VSRPKAIYRTTIPTREATAGYIIPVGGAPTVRGEVRGMRLEPAEIGKGVRAAKEVVQYRRGLKEYKKLSAAAAITVARAEVVGKTPYKEIPVSGEIMMRAQKAAEPIVGRGASIYLTTTFLSGPALGYQLIHQPEKLPEVVGESVKGFVERPIESVSLVAGGGVLWGATLRGGAWVGGKVRGITGKVKPTYAMAIEKGRVIGIRDTGKTMIGEAVSTGKVAFRKGKIRGIADITSEKILIAEKKPILGGIRKERYIETAQVKKLTMYRPRTFLERVRGKPKFVKEIYKPEYGTRLVRETGESMIGPEKILIKLPGGVFKKGEGFYAGKLRSIDITKPPAGLRQIGKPRITKIDIGKTYGEFKYIKRIETGKPYIMERILTGSEFVSKGKQPVIGRGISVIKTDLGKIIEPLGKGKVKPIPPKIKVPRGIGGRIVSGIEEIGLKKRLYKTMEAPYKAPRPSARQIVTTQQMAKQMAKGLEQMPSTAKAAAVDVTLGAYARTKQPVFVPAAIPVAKPIMRTIPTVQYQQIKPTQFMDVKTVTPITREKIVPIQVPIAKTVAPSRIVSMRGMVPEITPARIPTPRQTVELIPPTKVVEEPLLRVPTETVITTPVVPSYTPPPPFMFFPLPEAWGAPKKKKKRRLMFQPKKYRPSLAAVMLGITGKKPKRITGLEIRPMLKRRKRSKRKKRR